FDPDELIGRVANGSPATRLPQPPPYDSSTENFDLEFEPSPSSTRQMKPEQVDALNQLPDDLDDPMAESPRPWDSRRGNEHARRAAGARRLDAALGDEIDHEVSPALAAAAGDDLPFDPDEARAFDRAVAARPPNIETDAVYVSGFEETDMPPRRPGQGP